jgi:hypothetical protein
VGEERAYAPVHERRRHAARPRRRAQLAPPRLALGLGLLTKFSIAFFALPLLVAVLATPLRRGLLRPWPGWP